MPSILKMFILLHQLLWSVKIMTSESYYGFHKSVKGAHDKYFDNFTHLKQPG